MRALLSLALAACPRPPLASPPADACDTGGAIQVRDSVVMGFACGNEPEDARQRRIEAERPAWQALLASPEPEVVHLQGGNFGPHAGQSPELHGPQWEVYLVLERQPGSPLVASFDGVPAWVGAPYTSEYGSLIVEVEIFAMQLPAGRHTLLVTACGGQVVLERTLELSTD